MGKIINKPTIRKTRTVAMPHLWLSVINVIQPKRAGPTNAVIFPERAYKPNISALFSGEVSLAINDLLDDCTGPINIPSNPPTT